MNSKKMLWWRLGGGLCLVLAVALILLTLAAPPLVQSDAYKISYSVNGILYHDAKAFRSLTFDSKSYLVLPQASGLYRFIGVDWNTHRVFIPNIYSQPIFGWNCTHYDETGCSLNNPKLDGGWKINFGTNYVALASGPLRWGPKTQVLDVQVSAD